MYMCYRTAFPIGLLPCIAFLWYANIIVDYCGYSNLLISSFTFYIIRYICKCIQFFYNLIFRKEYVDKLIYSKIYLTVTCMKKYSKCRKDTDSPTYVRRLIHKHVQSPFLMSFNLYLKSTSSKKCLPLPSIVMFLAVFTVCFKIFNCLPWLVDHLVHLKVG